MTYTKIKTSPRSAFTLIELLTVIAIIGILAAIVIPTVGAVKKKAAMITSGNNLKQIAIGYASFSNSGTRSRVIQSGATGRYSASTPEEWAAVVARFGDLNEASVYFISAANDVANYTGSLPKRVVDESTAAKPIDPDFQSAASVISYDMAVGLSPNAGASSTPLIWTKGLATTGEWDPNSPWLGDGGHIAYVDGHVEFMNDTLGDGAGTGIFLDSSGARTANIENALGTNGDVVESPLPAE